MMTYDSVAIVDQAPSVPGKHASSAYSMEITPRINPILMWHLLDPHL